jgi:hypothetical protein
MKFLLRSSVLFVCLLVSAFAFAAPVCPYAPPIMDGIIDAWEWDSAETIDIQLNLPEGGTTTGRLYLMNDDKFLYVGLRVLREKADDFSDFQVILDANRDHTFSGGDDSMHALRDNLGRTNAVDLYYVSGGSCPIGQVCISADTDWGGRNDVKGVTSADGTYVTWELSKPLITFDGTDATMPAGSSIGMTFVMRLHSFGRVGDTAYPSWPWAGQYVDYLIRDCTYWR